MIKKEENILHEYLASLEQLIETVQSQSFCLQKKEWEKLKSLYGKKENIYLSLKKNDIKKLVNKDQNDYKRHKEKANKIINSIISIENLNKRLMKELMEEIKTELYKLNSKKRMYKTYLDSNLKQNQMGVNLVS